MSSWGSIAQKIRVPAGTLLGVVFLLLMHPSRRSLLYGGILAALGALLRLWASGHIDKGRALATEGPYAFTRNPLYLGSFLMALGVLLAGQGYWLLLAYGERFLEYSARVPLFLPGAPAASANTSSFLWSRVLRNREHRTLMGLAATEIFLILKAVL